MRNTFIDTLCEEAASNPNIWLLTADLGYSVMERFAERFPERYVNVGVAEQNMMGVAAGLALSGKIPVTYSIVNFATMRCLEQIRNDVCYHRANVKMVAVGAGYAYGAQGYTHHGVEDMAVMRALPGLTLIAPADPIETRLAVQSMLKLAGPVYLRLGRGGEKTLHAATPAFAIGRALEMRRGQDVALIACGSMLEVAIAAADKLAEQNVRATVVSMHTVKPLDADCVVNLASAVKAIVTLEEHGSVGGLGSAVADILAPLRQRPAFAKIAAPDEVCHAIGAQAHMRKRLGDVEATALRLLRDA